MNSRSFSQFLRLSLVSALFLDDKFRLLLLQSPVSPFLLRLSFGSFFQFFGLLLGCLFGGLLLLSLATRPRVGVGGAGGRAG